jgi:hypothetical protein
VKNLIAILFGLLLIWAQGDFTAGAASSSSSKSCACPGCKTPACCAKTPPPVSSQPVAPARNAQQTQSQLLQAVAAQLAFAAPAAGAEFVPPRSSASSKTIAVPLYRRNCSFLI